MDETASREGRCERLELDAGKVARPVLRGREVSNGLLLPEPLDISPEVAS